MPLNWLSGGGRRNLTEYGEVDPMAGTPSGSGSPFKDPGALESLYSAVNNGENLFDRLMNKMESGGRQFLANRADEANATDTSMDRYGYPGLIHAALKYQANSINEDPEGFAMGSAAMVPGMVGGRMAKGFGQAMEGGKVFEGVADTLPRFEISDAMSQLKSVPRALETKSLYEVLDHPELFKNYPELQNMNVKKLIPTMQNQGELGRYNPDLNEIAIAGGPEAKSTLLHELQHAIQNKERFQPGGNPGMDQGYRNLAGEVEARNVQKRMDWTPEMRESTPFNETFDVPMEELIMRQLERRRG